MDDRARLLATVPFFAGLGPADLALIAAAAREEGFAPGATIFREGDPADRFYIILAGTVEVWKDYGEEDQRDLIAEHGVGHLFGEMAVVDELPRSATVIAREAVRLLSVGRDEFRSIVAANGAIALSITRSVSAMVRSSNESFLENLHRRNRALLKANRELRRTQERLIQAERLSVLGKFASLVLHDIRNPIAILRGFAEMIQLAPDETALVERNIARIIAEADRLNRLASEMLDFSRGDIALNVSIVDLRELVAKVKDTLAEAFAARKVEVVSRVEFAGPVVLDADRMLRVLLNLADNARKAMPKGGTFTIGTSKKGRSVVFEIADTGVGMDQDVQKRLFEPFFTHSEEAGTGLGLCVVKNVVEAHHGKLTWTSEKGKGTTFRIALPMAG
jgi:signal transduction histidine kinase